MKLTRNNLKELIRQSIEEIDFKDQESFKKYQSQHKMRPPTKVNIGGKDTTVGQAGDTDGDGDMDRSGSDVDIYNQDEVHDFIDNVSSTDEMAGFAANWFVAGGQRGELDDQQFLEMGEEMAEKMGKDKFKDMMGSIRDNLSKASDKAEYGSKENIRIFPCENVFVPAPAKSNS